MKYSASIVKGLAKKKEVSEAAKGTFLSLHIKHWGSKTIIQGE